MKLRSTLQCLARIPASGTLDVLKVSDGVKRFPFQNVAILDRHPLSSLTGFCPLFHSA